LCFSVLVNKFVNHIVNTAECNVSAKEGKLELMMETWQLIQADLDVYGSLALELISSYHSTSYLNYCLCSNYKYKTYSDLIEATFPLDDKCIAMEIIFEDHVWPFLRLKDLVRLSLTTRLRYFVGDTRDIESNQSHLRYLSLSSVEFPRDRWVADWRNVFQQQSQFVATILFDQRLWNTDLLTRLNLTIIEQLMEVSDGSGGDYITQPQSNGPSGDEKQAFMKSSVMTNGVRELMLSFLDISSYLRLSYTCSRIWSQLRQQKNYMQCVELKRIRLDLSNCTLFNPSCSSWYYFRMGRVMQLNVAQDGVKLWSDDNIRRNFFRVPEHATANLRAYVSSHMLLKNPTKYDYSHIKVFNCDCNHMDGWDKNCNLI
ncbi:MAG: hypothetical protein ACPG2Y_03060, partial [Acholeplasmataceae bacterium]